jgi:hypothetical protein
MLISLSFTICTLNTGKSRFALIIGLFSQSICQNLKILTIQTRDPNICVDGEENPSEVAGRRFEL